MRHCVDFDDLDGPFHMSLDLCALAELNGSFLQNLVEAIEIHANLRGKIFVAGKSAGRPNLRCTLRHKSNSLPYTLANARLPLAIETRASRGISSS